MELKQLTHSPAPELWVAETTDEELPPIPDKDAIRAWLDAADRNPRLAASSTPPPGMGAGHYQRLQLDLVTGEFGFYCANWPQEEATRTRERGTASLIPSWNDWKFVPTQLYWVIDSGVIQLPYLNAAQGNALARRLLPLAEQLATNLQPVPGTDEWDWTAAAVRAAYEIERQVQRDPSDFRGKTAVDMGDAVAALPEIVDPGWAFKGDEDLDWDAGWLTRRLGVHSHGVLPTLLGVTPAESHRFEVVGTRAWLYGYRQRRARERTVTDVSRWFQRPGRAIEGRVSPDLDEAGLQQLAEAEERAAAEEDVALVGNTLDALRAERDRARAVIVEQLLPEQGEAREKAIKQAAAARALVKATLLQINGWGDPRYDNNAELGRAARMSRQAVDQLFDADDNDDDEKASAA
ncbi:hypothetical protein ACFV1W_30360 [Kitasatospora sp. NPDC059648]|uniref:hypothetical protein n=1 Tax=Kitasatospora sp. NPDC059648 TaxID=3346894 RepID=UPI0036B94063